MFIEADKHRTDNINHSAKYLIVCKIHCYIVVVLGVRYIFQSYFFILRSLR